MIEDLVETLDRGWQALEAEEGLDFALNCFRFHEQLTRDARTSGILEDLRREEEDSKSELRKAHQEIAAVLATIASELEQSAAEHFSPAPEDRDDYDASLPAIRRRLARATAREASPYDVGRERTDAGALSEVLALLDGVSQRANLPDVRERVGEVKRQLDHAHRTRRIFYLTSAGASLVLVERNLSDLHPPALDPGLEADIARMARARRSPLGEVAETLFGTGQADMSDPKIATLVNGMRGDMKCVYDDVRRRIGAERSLLAVIERYRNRCQWHDTERLRQIANKGRGAEDRLTETLAVYLFDHGLNPLTQPLAGRIRPDLLDAHSRFSFYVEAKQYSTAVPGYLLKGMQQVWDMLDQLKGSGFDVREAFYVVYRLGGPRYDFYPRIQHGGRVVYVIMIDLAATDERGSKAQRTETFTLADLLPKPVTGRGVAQNRVARRKRR